MLWLIVTFFLFFAGMWWREEEGHEGRKRTLNTNEGGDMFNERYHEQDNDDDRYTIRRINL